MDDYRGVRTTHAGARRCAALIAAALVALAAAGCGADKQAIPDPQKPPMPKTSQHQ